MIRRNMKRSLPSGIPGENTYKKITEFEKWDIKYSFENFHESYESLPQAQVKNLRRQVGNLKKKESKIKGKTNIFLKHNLKTVNTMFNGFLSLRLSTFLSPHFVGTLPQITIK